MDFENRKLSPGFHISPGGELLLPECNHHDDGDENDGEVTMATLLWWFMVPRSTQIRLELGLYFIMVSGGP